MMMAYIKNFIVWLHLVEGHQTSRQKGGTCFSLEGHPLKELLSWPNQSHYCFVWNGCCISCPKILRTFEMFLFCFITKKMRIIVVLCRCLFYAQPTWQPGLAEVDEVVWSNGNEIANHVWELSYSIYYSSICWITCWSEDSTLQSTKQFGI